MADFEEAMHQGYSREDMAADMTEMEIRADKLRCFECAYRNRAARACIAVLESEWLTQCPNFKKDGK